MQDQERFNNTLPWHELAADVTPSERVFVVHHLGIPQMPPVQDWYLVVDGLVERPLRLGLSDLQGFERREVLAVHECAGSPLRPTVPVRRVANVRWSGVTLASVLRGAGIAAAARYVWATGADGGIYPPTGHPNECYRKDLPLAKALQDEVLLAWEMNGAALDTRHGAPVRLVVPGFYGTNSVKWLTALSLQPDRADGYFTQTLYNDEVVRDGEKVAQPVWATAPNSVIVAPALGAQLPVGRCDIRGWAWGAAPIATVAVSTDGGQRWMPAQLRPRREFGWQGFGASWDATAGAHTLMCRATDAQGVAQPLSGARNEVMRLAVSVG
ncbi:sulfite oxidase [Ramlibacter alkalitolerans]